MPGMSFHVPFPHLLAVLLSGIVENFGRVGCCVVNEQFKLAVQRGGGGGVPA